MDIRHQLFVRIELATIHYYQSIESSLNDFNNIWQKTKDLGYSDDFTTKSVTFREVSSRTNFLEKVFFAIDYLIQQMNTTIEFHTNGTSHKKQHYFKLLLKKLDIENEVIDTGKIVDELIKHNTLNGYENIFKKGNNRKIELHELYNYLVTLRNVFHNNGYSQKTLNHLDIGGVTFEIKKGEQTKFTHDTIVIIVFLMLFPLERIVEQTFVKYPNQIWKDKYTQEIKEILEGKEK